MIIRDPDEMKKFADSIDTYCSEMRQVCKNLKSCLLAAESGMKDRSSKKAIQRVDQLADDLLAGLPVAESTSKMLRKAAEPLIHAHTIF